jgi:hypothetical protein
MQGPLWGAAARDWARLAEPAARPFYEAVFDAIGVGSGLALLDAGCGAGYALSLARERGAAVSGLDAEVPTPFTFPDLETAVRTQLSSGPARRATEHAGEHATREALSAAFAEHRQSDGSHRQDNVFRYLVARA